jgi:hypothetical protein
VAAQARAAERVRAQEGEEGMTTKEHAAAYLAKLRDRNGMIPDDMHDETMEEIVHEMEEAFAACARDASRDLFSSLDSILFEVLHDNAALAAIDSRLIRAAKQAIEKSKTQCQTSS